MARGINTGGHPQRRVGRDRFLADPSPPSPPSVLPSFPTAGILGPLQNPNAPAGTEQQVWENLVASGVEESEATNLTHQMPAYKWYEQENAQRVAALNATPTEGVGTDRGGGSSGSADIPPSLPEHYGLWPSQVTRIINSTRQEVQS